MKRDSGKGGKRQDQPLRQDTDSARESGASCCSPQSACSASERSMLRFQDWWDEQTAKSQQWATLERLVAREAWEAALKWSGYYEMQNEKDDTPK